MIRTHRPCLWLAVVMMAGIVAGNVLPIPLWVWLLLAAAAVAGIYWKPRSWFVYAGLFCLAAAWLQQQYRLPPDSIAFLQDPQAVQSVEGIVVSDVAKNSFELELRRGGKILVHFTGDHPPVYGERLRLEGKLQAPFEGNKCFSYRRYLQTRGIYWVMRVKEDKCHILAGHQGNVLMEWSLNLRHWMIGIFYRYLDPREAGFTAALVLGDRSGMPGDLKEIFVNTGTAHILAISGMNMAVIVTLFYFLLGLCHLPRQWQFAGTILFLFGYAFLSGWSASVVRSCIMSSVVLAGFAFEQESEPLNSLGLAAVILLTLDPRNLFDVGFQLSFAAVAAILCLYRHCEKLFQWLPGFIGTTMAVSLAAWIGTAPISFWHFHMITPISILANIPIVPLADLVMLLGLGLAFGGAWCPALGWAFAGCLKADLSAMVICADWFNQVPYGHFVFVH